MNFTSLLPKASFALLLLIFGCLVYMIARDRRQEQAQQARKELEGQRAAFSAGQAGSSVQTNSSPERRDEYAPLRPRPIAPAGTLPKQERRAPHPVPNRTVVAADEPEPGVDPAPQPVQVDYAAFAGTQPAAGSTGGGNTSLSGIVMLRGTPPPEKQIVLDPTCGRLHSKPLLTRHYVVGETGGLANVFVYVKSGAVSLGPPIARNVLLDQAGCEFQPYVAGVQVNQTLLVRNSDPLLHIVHATPARNPERRVTQRVKGMTTPFVFQRAEVLVRFKCDVHPWMFAYVGVVDHPWFAVTGSDGRFSLPSGLTTGRYTIAAVHPKSGEQTQDITISPSGSEPVTFVFEAVETLAAPSIGTSQAALR